MTAVHDFGYTQDPLPGLETSNLVHMLPQQPAPDVLKAYRFTARFSGGRFDNFRPVLMTVSGLRFNPDGGHLVVTRGVMPGASEFKYWMGGKHDSADLEIEVDGGIVFVALDCRPFELAYSHLDAGESARHVLIETLRLRYTSLMPEFHVIKEEK